MSATAAIPGGKSFSPPSGYNLEFRSLADDAWYAARAILSGKKLAVKYDDLDFVFEPHRFSDLDELRDYESRFRSVSRRLQDSECKKLCKKKAVCVSHSFHENDNRFYDATVDDVIEREHSFSSGKEVCKCVFAVVWQKGPWNGYVWHKSIEDIRIVESGSELDPDVTRFFNMARKEIAASGSASASASKAKNGVDDHQPANGTRSVEEDDWEDADFGRRNDRYALLVDNLEKDISSSTLKQFIHQETSLGVEVHVSSRLFPETLNKAVIVVESEQQLDELYKFLDCPAQIVVTGTGRPLVVTEKKFEFDTLAMMRMEGLIDMGRGSYMQGGGIGVKHGLKVVRKGSVEFEEAKEMKDLFVEFSHHQRGLLKKQVEKEKEIMEAGNA